MFMFLGNLLGSGPIWHDSTHKYIKACYDNWWTNLLFINNFYDAEHMVRIFKPLTFLIVKISENIKVIQLPSVIENFTQPAKQCAVANCTTDIIFLKFALTNHSDNF